MLLLVNPKRASVGKAFITFVALVWFVSCVNMLMFFHQFEVVETFVTGSTSKLIIPCVFAFVVTQSLDGCEAFTTLVTYETTFAQE